MESLEVNHWNDISETITIDIIEISLVEKKECTLATFLLENGPTSISGVAGIIEKPTLTSERLSHNQLGDKDCFCLCFHVSDRDGDL